MNDLSPHYNLRQLASVTGQSLRLLRGWFRTGVLSSTEFRGPATTYGPRHVEEIRVVLHLRSQGLSLDTIRKKRLRDLSMSELARLATIEPLREPPPAPVPEAIAAAPVVEKAAAIEPEPAPAPASPPASAGAFPLDRWDHVVLLPGLELRVKSDAGALLRRIAQEIYSQYGVGA